MDEKKREDKEFIDGAAVDSSETENGSVTADDLLGSLILSPRQAQLEYRREQAQIASRAQKEKSSRADKRHDLGFLRSFDKRCAG